MSNKFPMMSAEIGPVPETEFNKPRSKFVKLSSIRSSKSKGGEDEKRKQIQDYVVWVNSYLRSRPGTPQITDLKLGMQDGITIVNLVEAAANADIPFVNRKPSSSSARKANIEKAIAFLKSDGANVTGDPVKDISDGNIKGMMKIILVVAEKYNPRSVRPIIQSKISSASTSSSSSSQHPHSHTSQSLTTPSGLGKSPERVRENHTLSTSPRGTSPVPQPHPFQQSRSHSQSDPHAQSYPHSPSSYPHGQSYPHSQFHSYPHSHQHPPPPQPQQFNGSSATRPQPVFALSQGYALSQGFSNPQGIPGDMSTEGGMGGVGFSLSQPVAAQSEDIYTDPVDSLPKNVTQRIYNHMSGNRLLGHKPPGKTHNRLSVPSTKPTSSGIPEGTVAKEVKSFDQGKPDTIQKPPPDNSLIFGEINGTLSGLGNLKIELLKLHTVLLDNVGDEEMKEGTVDMKLPLEVANSEIMTRDKELSELQANIDKVKEALEKSESECETLKDMVMERNQFITGMKTEIYRKEYRNDTEKVDLQTQVLHKDRKIKILEGELNLMKASVEGKDREVVDMRKKRAELEVRESELQDEVTQITSELTRAVEAEETLQAKIFSRDRKITHLEEKLEVEKGILQRIDPTVVSEEMESIREMFMGLRESMDANSSNQQTLDSLEKTISNMITKFTDHVRSISPNRRPRRHHDEKREERKKRHRERGESRSSRDEVDRVHHSLPPGEWTKVYYYITGDKMETPYSTSVPRKASEVRLKDFKAVFDRHGCFRFYFKTEDPDCGVVREEIVNDDHILPAWNGKIMVWVTEKAHHR